MHANVSLETSSVKVAKSGLNPLEYLQGHFSTTRPFHSSVDLPQCCTKQAAGDLELIQAPSEEWNVWSARSQLSSGLPRSL